MSNQLDYYIGSKKKAVCVSTGGGKALQTEGISMRMEGSGWERDWLLTGLPIKKKMTEPIFTIRENYKC